MPRFRGVSRRFDSYQQLMQVRIRRILLVSSLYDAYVLEEDETLEEQLWDQYMDQRLSSAPHITKILLARTYEEAVALAARYSDYLLGVITDVSFSWGGQVEIGDDLRRQAWCRTHIVQGNGTFSDLFDIVYVKREAFDKALSQRIAAEVGQLNKALVDEGRRYVLVGFGRWGSTDPWMGIGVRWHQINGVQVLVEVGLPHFDVEPSQGTHFFQNITSLNIGCLSLPHGDERACFDWEWLESLPVHQETGFLRHVRLQAPLRLAIDGRGSEAVLAPPG